MMEKLSSCWPTKDQELLLKAALLKGKQGLTAWKKWRKVDFNTIDYGSLRLIPQLYQNLLNQDVQLSVIKRYKGIYRSFWAKNQLLFHKVKPLMGSLVNAGVEVMLFKGVGLILRHNLDIALRPMEDIDILVQQDDVNTILSIVKEHGWQPKAGCPTVINDTTTEISFQNESGQFIDIHFHALLYGKWGQHESSCWERAVEGKFFGIPIKIMDDSDHLIHIVVHGLSWNVVPPFRWIADSMLLLNKPCSIEWDYLVEQSKRLRVTIPMYYGLKYLKEKMYVTTIPNHVLKALKRYPTSFLERMAYKLRTEPIRPFLLNARIIRILTYYLFRPQYPFPGIIRYFQMLWGLDSISQVPYEAMRKLLLNDRENRPANCTELDLI